MPRDLEFLFELGMLRHIKRAWVQLLTPDFENLADHMFRVAWLALTISKMEKAGDHEKILKMALLHDIAESRTGDVHYISRQYTKRNDLLAMTDMLGGTVQADMMQVWEEYERRESIEAKIVKDADTLSVDMELAEQAYLGNSLQDLFEEHRQKVANNSLFTVSAKKLWHEIQHANPHDWHLKGRNRFNAGDWKDYK
jgi:putative hydrolase of HD superfamily